MYPQSGMVRQPRGYRSGRCDSQSYDGLKVRFSATLGEEPEVEVTLVWLLRACDSPAERLEAIFKIERLCV